MRSLKHVWLQNGRKKRGQDQAKNGSGNYF
jgi:hypothetical protein